MQLEFARVMINNLMTRVEQFIGPAHRTMSNNMKRLDTAQRNVEVKRV
jgi:hypothetical protein